MKSSQLFFFYALATDYWMPRFLPPERGRKSSEVGRKSMNEMQAGMGVK